MRHKWARCAACGKATWYCARYGCGKGRNSKPAGQPAESENSVWIGICETPHGTAFVIDKWELTAQIKLFDTWLRSVYEGFAEQNSIRNFKDLQNWNGARVIQIEIGSFGIWERM